MGVAAYNRGTKAINDALDRESTPHDILWMRDVSDWSARHEGRVGFAPTIIRFHDDGTGYVSLMNRPDRGWAEFGYTYDSVWTLARHWRIVVVGMGHDKFSRFVRVVPLPR